MSRILNNTKVLIFIIAILLFANIAIVVFFLTGKPGEQKQDHNKSKSGFPEFLINDVKFSAGQMKQYDSLKKEHWKEIKPLFKATNACKDSFYIHISDPVVSEQFLLQATDSIAKNQQRTDLDMFSHFRNIRSLCTEDQKPVFDSLVQDVIKKMMNPYRKDVRQKGNKENKDRDSARGQH